MDRRYYLNGVTFLYCTRGKQDKGEEGSKKAGA
jgi:hypothetical protein